MNRTEKAVLLVVRSYSNELLTWAYKQKTVAQFRADFVTAFNALL